MVRIKDTNPHYSAKAAPTRVDAIPTSPDTHIGNDAATGEAAFTVLPVKFDGDCAPHIRKLRKYADCCVGEAQEVSLPPKKVLEAARSIQSVQEIGSTKTGRTKRTCR